MPNKISSALVLALGLSAASLAQATILYDNITQTIAGGTDIYNFGPMAASFSAGSTNSILGEVTVILHGDNAVSGSIQVSLYGDGSSAPGSLISPLFSIPAASLTSTYGPQGYDASILNLVLTAGDRYWIELSSGAAGSEWAYAVDDSGTGVAGESSAYTATTSFDNVYSNLYGAMLMEVQTGTPTTPGGGGGSSTVPEPASLALLGLGLVGLGYARRNRAH